MKVGWQNRNLGELCRIRTGKKDVNEGNPEGEYPFFTCAAQHTFSDTYSFDTEALLIAGNGDVGKVSYYKGKFEAYQRTYVISDFAEVLPRFLYLILDGKLKDTVSKQKLGNTMPYIKVGMLTDFQLPVPPLTEQQRIVGLLDEAFAGLATAKANAEKNLQNARALFESHLQSVFAEMWSRCELVTLADLATDITDGDHLPPPKSQTGVPFITIGNVVKQTRQIDFTDTFTVPRAYYDALKPQKKPKRGDVLYTVTGSFGIPVMVPDGVEFCFQRHIGLIRPKPETDTSWLYYLLLSPQLFRQANDGATGAAQRTVSLKLLRSFDVPRVPPEQQKKVAAKLRALSKETQRLASLYERKLAALEALKKSLLHQAFTGAL